MIDDETISIIATAISNTFVVALLIGIVVGFVFGFIVFEILLSYRKSKAIKAMQELDKSLGFVPEKE